MHELWVALFLLDNAFMVVSDTLTLNGHQNMIFLPVCTCFVPMKLKLQLSDTNSCQCLLTSRYAAAVEMLGERDEALEELRADLQDVKNLYRDQIEFMVMQLVQHQQAPAAGVQSAPATS